MTMNNQRPFYFFLSSVMLLISVSFCSQAKVTELTATVDKNPALIGESIVLEVVANDSVDQGGLDTSALLKDFVVGRTSVSRQTQMINFNTTQTTRWQTILIPRNPGQFTIPSFEINGVRSNPINLQILPESRATQRQQQDVFITTEIDKTELYLQQQATYTVKLHIAQDLQRGSLTEPQLADATIQQIGKDKEYSQLVNGKRYRVVERNFAIQPQRSGAYVIEGPVFQGEIVTRSRGSNLFNMFNETKPISRLSPKLSIEVLPIPDDYAGHWLPSEYVALTEEWQPQQSEYILGEPITRTVTLTAIGVSEEQLPEIAADYPNQVKVYPDKSDTTTVERDNQLIAQRIDSFAIVSTQTGAIKLPEIKIPWFNSKTGKQEFVTLPEKRITILPDPNQQTAPIIANPIPVETNLQPEVPELSAIQTVENPLWQIATVLFAGVWLLTALGWIFHVRKISKVPLQKTANQSKLEATEAALWQQLKQAIKQQDAAKTNSLLLPWLISALKRDWTNIQQAVNYIGNENFAAAVSNLQQNLYAQNSADWDAKQLSDCVKSIRKKTQAKKKTVKQLPALYPA